MPTIIKDQLTLKEATEQSPEFIEPGLKSVLQKKNMSLKKKLDEVMEMKTLNIKHRIHREVTRFILDMHVFKKSRFDPKNFALYSEEDYKVKFWSHLLEELFSTSTVILHWGDTVPKTFSNSSLKPKIDIRIMNILESSEPDFAVGEFAKSPTANKMYHDKLKSVLITKKHLNSPIKRYECIKNVPFFLIMGFNLLFLEMNFDKSQGFYTIDTIASCSFPVTKSMINNNGIENVIGAVEAIKKRINGIKVKADDCQRSNELNKMNTIIKGSPEDINHPSCTISPVIWPSDTNLGSLDEDEDEEYEVNNFIDESEEKLTEDEEEEDQKEDEEEDEE